jgi:hypothetical protein
MYFLWRSADLYEALLVTSAFDGIEQRATACKATYFDSSECKMQTKDVLAMY